MCCFLLFCSCFRTVTTEYDTRRYIDYFIMFRDMSLSECLKIEHEEGYIILTKLIGKITDQPQVFLSILSMITLSPIFILIWFRSDNPLLSLLIFVTVGNLFSSYTALRQWCAVAIFSFGYTFIIKRKPIPFFMSIVLSYFFHRSALFMIPLYFLHPLKINRNKILFCLALSFAMAFAAEPIMSILNLFARMDTEYSSNGGFVLLLAYWGIVFIIDFLAYPIENEKYMKLNYMALLYSAIMQPLCFTFSGFARIHLYTWFGFVLGIPSFARYMERDYDWRNSFILRIVVSSIMIAWYLVTQVSSELTLVFFEKI